MESATPKTADKILERIFQPTTKPTALDQAEETLRHPKRIVYVATSNRNYYWRGHLQKFVLDSGLVPLSPFMLFDYYLLHTVPKNIVREAMNNLLARSDEVWVFGALSLGVKVQIGIAKRMQKSVRYFDISDLPSAVLPISEETAQEELRD
ncbi:MAG: hypothetical protein ACRENM_05190 [Candidatus Dormibacteraceae bacterium]